MVDTIRGLKTKLEPVKGTGTLQAIQLVDDQAVLDTWVAYAAELEAKLEPLIGVEKLLEKTDTAYQTLEAEFKEVNADYAHYRNAASTQIRDLKLFDLRQRIPRGRYCTECNLWQLEICSAQKKGWVFGRDENNQPVIFKQPDCPRPEDK